MRKILVICGPTATGKTSLGIELGKKFDGEIVSADSRQVYSHMDVVTGKDIPKNFEYKLSDLKIPGTRIGYYTDGKIKIWGYDLVRPDQEFSVKLYFDFTTKALSDIYDRNKLSILVGGTGLFVKAVLDCLEKIHVPKNNLLRKKLTDKTPEELFRLLIKKRPMESLYVNRSDRSNSRRLIRMLEVADYEDSRKSKRLVGSRVIKEKPIRFDKVLQIGLKAKRKSLYKRIDKRVDSRLGAEMDEEIEYLKKKDFLRYAPKVTIGYKEWIDYLEGKLTRIEAVKKWKIAERRYAKRQLTWFRKDKRIVWFDIGRSNWKKDVEKTVQEWYSSK